MKNLTKSEKQKIIGNGREIFILAAQQILHRDPDARVYALMEDGQIVRLGNPDYWTIKTRDVVMFFRSHNTVEDITGRS